MKNKEVNDYILGLGWSRYEETGDSPTIDDIKMGSYDIGDTWYYNNSEDGFNTGTDYYLAISPKTTMDSSILIAIFELTYGSYSMSAGHRQYSLENIQQLPQLMRFKRIKQ